MNRSVFGLAFAALLFALRFYAEAQHPNKVPRIANQSRIDSATDTMLGTFRFAPRELGFTDGKNLAALAPRVHHPNVP
jgi:hypothetical protein